MLTFDMIPILVHSYNSLNLASQISVPIATQVYQDTTQIHHHFYNFQMDNHCNLEMYTNGSVNLQRIDIKTLETLEQGFQCFDINPVRVDGYVRLP